ncbi:hypothetical protein EZI54_06270 [Marinobacter halodurans]|uniref:DUF2809 domain-containing protein n=1 Tax=Marinobacter halodurans TaxID=2528979 RepID=A0ABY1ZMR2_9GAMM|nr:hypothetical protein [Marinobacter halodurans]TBW57640.1 hypothetical protein EZI54_06270 [Marinobacter halodurans]
MSAALMIKTLLVWLGILALAIGNGVLREALLMPVFGAPAGLVLSGVLLSGLILGVAYAVLPWFGRLPLTRYWAIGMTWLCLTLVFEFGFGYLVQGKSWPQLFEAYTFQGGNIWPIVLLVVATAPRVAVWLRRP